MIFLKNNPKMIYPAIVKTKKTPIDLIATDSPQKKSCRIKIPPELLFIFIKKEKCKDYSQACKGIRMPPTYIVPDNTGNG